MSAADPRLREIAEPQSPRIRSSRLGLFAWLGVAFALGVVPLELLPPGKLRTLWADLYWGIAQLAVGLRCMQTARRTADRDRKTWLCFGFASIAYSIGTFWWTWYEVVADVLAPIPSWADVSFLAFSPLMLAGLWLYRDRAPSKGIALVQIGNLGVIVSAVVVANLIFFFDVLQASTSPRLSIVTVSYAVVNTTLFFFGLVNASLYLSGPKQRVIVPIVLACAMIALADNIAAYRLISNSFASTDFFNTLYLLAFACIHWSASEDDRLEPSQRFVAPAPERERRARQWETLLAPASVACVLIVATLFARALTIDILPYTGTALLVFVAALATRDWWAQQVESELRVQAQEIAAELKQSEKHLLIKNEKLAMTNQELWEEMRLRLIVQEDLRQAQKMEALGQLTGGVAHDFNNLLAVIIGNLELIEHGVREGGELEEPLNEAHRAADRGSALTQRLLAFSRRQTLRPEAVDAIEFLEEMTNTVANAIGPAISLDVRADADVWGLRADRTQLENVVLNLALNARDAMCGSGRLEIRAWNETVDRVREDAAWDERLGDFVVLGVSDTGIGIPEQIQHKIFDPFFTTKELGSGTGLGLSMAYGFAKQSGGHIEISSEEGRGTEVRLYLPRCDDELEEKNSTDDERAPRGRGETLLVVEDEPGIRKLIVTMLSDLGYRVIGAGDALEALEIAATLEPLDLLLSDIVLPGRVSGRELASRILEERPKTPILLMSGYSGDPGSADEAADEDSEILAKPFRRRELAKRVRERIDASAR